MDGFIKWNCYDLAEQIEVFERVEKELSLMNEELSRQARLIEPASPENSEQIRKLLTRINEIIHRLNVEQKTLDQGIDIYFAAETQARIQVETLRTTTKSSAVVVSDIAAATGNSIMEDWLAAMAYAQG